MTDENNFDSSANNDGIERRLDSLSLTLQGVLTELKYLIDDDTIGTRNDCFARNINLLACAESFQAENQRLKLAIAKQAEASRTGPEYKSTAEVLTDMALVHDGLMTEQNHLLNTIDLLRAENVQLRENNEFLRGSFLPSSRPLLVVIEDLRAENARLRLALAKVVEAAGIASAELVGGGE